MQQAIYNPLTLQSTTKTATTTTSRQASLGRRLARTWELAGVLALMASSAAYGVFAIAHTS